jgi:predicted nucleic acid-binding protein
MAASDCILRGQVHFTVFGPASSDILSDDEVSHRPGGQAVAFEVEATYENGVLKLDQPIPFAEQERLVLRITPKKSHVQEFFGIHVLPVTSQDVLMAGDLSIQHGLLSGDAGDALLIAIMRSHGLTHLASNDADFDRVPGITRYAPV